jgi:DNA-binding beta-propeller fold protein YncE
MTIHGLVFAASVLASAATVTLPGGPPVGMDYLAYDAASGRIWVPAGNTGNVDVVDVETGKVTTVGGFATRPSPHSGRPSMGPSSVTIAGGVVWIGNRGDDRLCAFDARTLKKGACVGLASMPDGIAWVAPTHELWATTPRNDTLTIVGVSAGKPGAPAVVKLDGAPEGYAVDAARGVFYTNLEDKDRTLVIDVKTHTVRATWNPGCGADGPRGIAIDPTRNFVFVACTESLHVLDGGHDGAPLGKLDTGAGVDNIEYLEPTRWLYIAAGKAARLTVARIDDKGQPSVVASGATAEGARNAVVDSNGTIYLVDRGGAARAAVTAPGRCRALARPSACPFGSLFDA